MNKEMKEISQCPACSADIHQEDAYREWKICQMCQHHFPLAADQRLRLILDEGSFVPLAEGLSTENTLGFPDYMEKVELDQKKTGLEEAVLVGTGTLANQAVVIGAMDHRFRMGSLGSVVGEKIIRAIRHATRHRLPVILFSCSGGARMQEGIFSLMQMGRTAMELSKFHQAGGLYISVLTHPTTGGVTASFASLGDIILAEPGALIGFAGPRVIEQTIREELPKGFQCAEFLLEKGFLDMVVSRKDMRHSLIKFIQFHKGLRSHG